MHPDAIKKVLQATPFVPFTVYLPSEKAFRVAHQDFAWLTPSGRTLMIASLGGDGADILDVALITKIEVQHTTAADS